LFNPRLEENPANMTRWPVMTHDRTQAQEKAMYLQLMVRGKYIKDNCRLSLVKPTALGGANVEANTTRLAEIYQG
jgi:hypothetical protein